MPSPPDPSKKKYGDWRDDLVRSGYGPEPPRATYPDLLPPSDSLEPGTSESTLPSAEPVVEKKAHAETTQTNARPSSTPLPWAGEDAGRATATASSVDDDEFDMDKVKRIIKFETAGTNDPSIVAKNSPSHAGLIQFGKDIWPGVAQAHGTPNVSWDDMRRMSYEEQLPYVKTYLRSKGITKDSSIGDYYLAVAAPGVMNKDDEYVAYSPNTKGGRAALKANPGWDINNDGKITRGELRQVGERMMPTQDVKTFNMEEDVASQAPIAAGATSGYVDTLAPGFESTDFAKSIQQRIDSEHAASLQQSAPLGVNNLSPSGQINGDPTSSTTGGDPTSSTTTRIPVKPTVQEYLRQHQELLPQNQGGKQAPFRVDQQPAGRALTPEQKAALETKGEPQTVSGAQRLSSLADRRDELDTAAQTIEEERARREADAQRQLGEIGIKKNQAEMDLLQRQQNDRANLRMRDMADREDIDRSRQVAMKQFTDLSDKPPVGKIDASRWMKGDGNKGRSILHALASFGAGWIGKPEIVTQAIDRNIAVQAANIKNAKESWQQKVNSKFNLIGLIDKKMNDVERSTAIAEAYLTKQAITEAQRISASANNDVTKANIEQLIPALQDKLNTIETQYAERQINREQVEARSAAEAESLARQNIYKIGDQHLQFKGLDANGKPLFRKPGEGGKVSEGTQKLNEQIAALEVADQELAQIPEGTVDPERDAIWSRWLFSIKRGINPTWAQDSKSIPERALSRADFNIAGLAATAGELGVLRDEDLPRIDAAKGGSIQSRRELIQSWAARAAAKKEARGEEE